MTRKERVVMVTAKHLCHDDRDAIIERFRQEWHSVDEMPDPGIIYDQLAAELSWPSEGNDSEESRTPKRQTRIRA